MKVKALVAAAIFTVGACGQATKHSSSVQEVGKASDGLSEQDRNRFVNAYLEQMAWAANLLTPADSDSPALKTVLADLRSQLRASDAVRSAIAAKLGTPENQYPNFLNLKALSDGQVVQISGPTEVFTALAAKLRAVNDAGREAAIFSGLKSADEAVLTNLDLNIAPLDVHGDWAAAITASRDRLQSEIQSLSSDSADAVAQDSDAKSDRSSDERGAESRDAAAHGR